MLCFVESSNALKDNKSEPVVSGHGNFEDSSPRRFWLPYLENEATALLRNVCNSTSRHGRHPEHFIKTSRRTWRSWIRASWYSYENNQQDAIYRLIYYSMSALHISGDVFAHYQENLTVFTVSGSVHPSCCRHQPAATWVNTTRYCKYNQVLLMMGENIARNM